MSPEASHVRRHFSQKSTPRARIGSDFTYISRPHIRGRHAGLSGIYYAKDAQRQAERESTARQRLDKIETALADERGNNGPFFNGPDLSLVDAAYAPFLQRFLYVDQWLESGLFQDYPLVRAWAQALLASEVVEGSVPENFFSEFKRNMQRRGFVVGALMDEEPGVAAR